MLAADVGRALLLASVPVAHWLGALGLAQLYAVAFAVGTLDVVFFVAYNTIFVAVTPPQQLLEGQALLNGSRAVAQVGGQSLAGLLVAALTAPVALLVDAASFVASAGALASIRPVEPAPAPAERGATIAGVRFLVRSPVIRRVLGATATVNYFNFVFFAIFVLFVVRTLGISAAMLGLVLGAGAVGAVAGSLVANAITRRLGVGRAFALSCVLFPAPMLLVPLAPAHARSALLLLFLAEFGSGLGVMILDITGGGILAAAVPDAVRSRVAGAYRMVNYGMRPLGALTGGWLADVVGLRLTLWIAAAGGVTCVAWLIRSPVLQLRDLTPAGDDHSGGALAAEPSRQFREPAYAYTRG
jgi:predicted MFS family arabinose efflux permease